VRELHPPKAAVKKPAAMLERKAPSLNAGFDQHTTLDDRKRQRK